MSTKKKSIIIIVIILLFITGFSLMYIIIRNNETVVDFIEYYAYYEEDFNNTKIIEGLEEKNISYYLCNESNAIHCYFGKSFNNISLKDTSCWINSFGKNRISVRLYNADVGFMPFNTREALDENKPDLRKSMAYITSIVENSTGQKPFKYKFMYADGGRLRYPD